MVDAAAVLTRLTAESEAMIAETARLARIDSGSEDPAGVARYVPDLDPTVVDDAKAARIAHTMVELLRNFSLV